MSRREIVAGVGLGILGAVYLLAGLELVVAGVVIIRRRCRCLEAHEHLELELEVPAFAGKLAELEGGPSAQRWRPLEGPSS